MIRRLFSFLFRHDWQVIGGRVREENGVLKTTLVCSRCGVVSPEYSALDRTAFLSIYRRGGCPGPTRKDPP